MHELSLCRSIADLVVDAATEAGARRVRRITLEIGRGAPVEIEAIRFSLPLCLEDTVAAGAELTIERPLLEMRCGACGLTHESVDSRAPCPACGASTGTIVSGRQMRVVSIEAE